MVTKRARGFHRFLKTVDSFTEGQVQVTDWDCDHLGWVDINIKPNDGYYKGGVFKFKVRMMQNYPNEPPSVICCTDIFHPNIDPSYDALEDDSSNVCVSTLDDWQNGMGLEDVVQGLLFLFHNPNPGDALSPYFGGFGDQPEDWEEFGENVLNAIKGGEVEGHKFENCWCENGEEGSKDEGEESVNKTSEDGACAVLDQTECPNINDVEVIINKVSEIILKRTEEGKDESDDEMEDNHKRDSDTEEDVPDDDDQYEVDSTVGGTDSPDISEVESEQPVYPGVGVQNSEQCNNQNEQNSQIQSGDDSVDTVIEGASSRMIISRQNSKLDRDPHVTTTQEPNEDQTSFKDLKENCDSKVLIASQFVAPGFELGLYAFSFSVICLYSIYRTFSH